MAEPKKETVRIALPPRPEQAASAPNVIKRDTARIVLPSRTPVTPVRRLPPKIMPLPSSTAPAESPAVVGPRRPPVAPPNVAAASPLLQPLPKPPGLAKDTESTAAIDPGTAPDPGASNRGPKKETARISILPRPAPAPSPSINMTKTQPLLIHPVAPMQSAPVVITSRPMAPLDAIPRSICWALFGVSAFIFLIQIWNYVVS